VRISSAERNTCVLRNDVAFINERLTNTERYRFCFYWWKSICLSYAAMSLTKRTH